MPQSLLTSENGVLGLQIFKSNSNSVATLVDHEWTRSYIDEICVEELLELSLLEISPPGPRVQRRRRGNSRLSKQYRLTNQMGVMMLQKPRIGYFSNPESYRCIETITATKSTARSSHNRTTIMSLPVELRQRIYHYLLVSSSFPVICPHVKDLRILTHINHCGSLEIFPQILATCHQINEEGTPILYGENLFYREFYWRIRRNAEGKAYPVPLSRSCRLRARNLMFVQRVSLLSQCRQWLQNGDLKVLRDFPSLRELRFNIFLNDPPSGVDLDILWQKVMKSIDRKRPILQRLDCGIVLDFDTNFHSWGRRSRERNGGWEFSLHRQKKGQLEKWIEEEGLFSNQHIAWSFNTIISQHGSCYRSMKLVIDNRRNASRRREIQCIMADGSETKLTTEPA